MTLIAIPRAILRSLNGRTGALIGGLGGAAPVLSQVIAESFLGRPSSTSGFGVPVGLFFGLLGAGLGGMLGRIVESAVSRTRWAGPVSRPVVVLIPAILIAVSGAIAIQQVRSTEAFNEPRIINSTGAVRRVAGNSVRAPRSPATLLYSSLPDAAKDAMALRWNARLVRVELSDDKLRLLAEGGGATSVDLSGFDYVREVHAVTARLQDSPSEWLVLLVRLRATGRRELLLIHDPEAMLVHQELLERTSRLQDGPVMWRAGPESGPHEVTIDFGTPIHYSGIR